MIWRLDTLSSMVSHDRHNILKSLGQTGGLFRSETTLSARDKKNKLLLEFIDKYGGKMDSAAISWAASVTEWLESTIAWDDTTTYLEVVREFDSWKREQDNRFHRYP